MARTTAGAVGIKVWIYIGEVLPGMKEAEMPKPQRREPRRGRRDHRDDNRGDRRERRGNRREGQGRGTRQQREQ